MKKNFKKILLSALIATFALSSLAGCLGGGNDSSSSSSSSSSSTASGGGDTTSSSTPDEDTTSSSTPDEDTTSSSTPDEDTTSSSTPDEDTTSSSTPDEDTTSSSTPDEDTTSSSTPDEDTTSSSTPDEDTTSSSTPDEDTTSSSTPDEDTTSSSTPGEDTTSSSTPDDSSDDPTPDCEHNEEFEYVDNEDGTHTKNCVCGEEIETVAHVYDTWNTDDVDYDYKACACGAIDETVSFKKSITDARVEFYATAETAAITMTGCDEYASVKDISLGGISLGANPAALKVEAIKDATEYHGEVNLSVTVLDANGDEHVIAVPVLIVTADIATAGELYKAIYPTTATEQTEPVNEKDEWVNESINQYGYYRLTADIDYRPGEVEKELPYARFWGANPDNATAPTWDGATYAAGVGFRGTLDGQNHTVRTASTHYGTFNSLIGATVKNVVLEDWYAYGSLHWAVFMAYDVVDTTFENVNITIHHAVAEPYQDVGDHVGFFAANTFTGNTLKNVVIDMANSSFPDGLAIGSLFGSGMDDTNVFEGCKLLNCGGLKEFGHNGDVVYDYVEGMEAYVKGAISDAYNLGIIIEETEYQLSLTEDPSNPIPEGMVISKLIYEGNEIEHEDLFIDPSAIFTYADLGMHNFIVEAVYQGYVYYTYTVPVEITSYMTIEEKTYAGAAKELILTQTDGNATLDLTDVTELDGLTISGISYGEYLLGNDATNLTIPEALLADVESHGEGKTLTIIAEKEDYILTLTLPATIVTKAIGSTDDFIAVFTYPTAKAYYGYYTLSADIGWGGGNMWAFHANDRGSANNEWRDYGFRGTFDGKGYTITGRQQTGGLFGWVGTGAILKNFTVNDVYFTQGTASVLGFTLVNATVENVTVNFVPHSEAAKMPTSSDENQKTMGWLVNNWSYGSTFKNCTVNAEGYDVYSLFGSGWYSGYEHSNTKAGVDTVESKNTYENFRINANSLRYVGYWYENGTSGSDYGTFNGVTAAQEVAAGEGIYYNGVATVSETTEIKLNQETATVNLGEAYAGATVVSVHCGEDLLSNSATFNTDAFTSADYGPTTLTVVVKVAGENGEVNMTLTVPANVSSGYTQVTLNKDRQDVILSGETYSVDLGEYAGGTILSIATDSYALGTDPAALDVTALKADPQTHGVQNLRVIMKTAAGEDIELLVPVTIVTRAFTSVNDFQHRNHTQSTWSGSNPFTFDNVMYGYYILSNDIGYYKSGGDFDAIAYGNTASTKPSGVYWTNSEYGFRGTFDGRGHSIAGLIYGAHGLFAGIGKGAVIKDTTFTLGMYDATAVSSSVLANTINDATIENVTVKVVTMMKDATAAATPNVGLLCFTGAYRNTFKNLQIISESAYNCTGIIGCIFGSGGYGFRVDGGNTFENCSIKAIGLLELGSIPAYAADPIVEVDAFADKGLTVTLTGANA